MSPAQRRETIVLLDEADRMLEMPIMNIKVDEDRDAEDGIGYWVL